jgi:hypothetical protein
MFTTTTEEVERLMRLAHKMGHNDHIAFVNKCATLADLCVDEQAEIRLDENTRLRCTIVDAELVGFCINNNLVKPVYGINIRRYDGTMQHYNVDGLPEEGSRNIPAVVKTWQGK